jgi:protocatechuate 3,4-dioxygenase beta subunit
MEDFNEFSVTEAVIAQMATTPDDRLREIMASAVRHLHAFARDVRLTPAEWLMGIKFMTDVGKACTPYRQEFVLLSDVLGLSSLVNVLHDATRMEHGTDTSLLGPFYREGAPELRLGDNIARTAGPPVILFGQVVDADGRGIAGAHLQVWQTDERGEYDLQKGDPRNMDDRGCFTTDGVGRFHFRSVRPLGYTIPMDGPVGALINAQRRHGCRPAHIHFLISAPGYRELVTSIYLGDDPHIDSDTVFGVSKVLVVHAQTGLADSPDPSIPGIRYEFRLAKASAADSMSRVGSDPSKLVAV